ncbi:ABC transporter ATP-binding protein [Caulobacter sp. BP25]|uniref:ABC transporter ATP-binding protein n=1 Tax=Caulobacter sp. BP25 TaxID=2048900 RepID=UPI00137477D0|nr:ABC transporter ATP-binding protein [Caulobacter sp. BP25]
MRLNAREVGLLPLVLLLGVAASLAESLGISFVVVFLYVAIGDGAGASGSANPLLREAMALTHGLGGGAAAIIGLILVFMLARILFTLAYNLVTSRIRNRISQKTREEIYRQYLTVSYQDIARSRRGDLINTLATESFVAAEAYFCAAQIGISLGAALVFCAFLCVLSWQIAVIALPTALLVLLAVRLISFRTRRLDETISQSYRNLSGQMVSAIHGMKTLRVFALEKRYEASFKEASGEARRSAVAAEQLRAMLYPLGEISYLVLLGAIALAGGRLGITTSVIIGSVALLYRLQPHLRELEQSLMRLLEIRSVLTRLSDAVGGIGRRYPEPGRLSYAGFQEDVSFEGVTFRYPGAEEDALREVGFSIRRGEVTALAGPSGAGKTTIVNLLMRLYDLQAGVIRADGTPLTEIKREDWLCRIAVAGQDVELMDDTVVENIRLARPDASFEDVRRAAADAGALEFIEALPDGFDQWIGEGGSSLSGGQRQRLGLARALLAEPDILVLDEALNAVDGALEDRIREAVIARFRERGAVLLITHRLDSLLDADRVVCLDHGRVVEDGAPRALLARPGPFSRMLGRSA